MAPKRNGVPAAVRDCAVSAGTTGAPHAAARAAAWGAVSVSHHSLAARRAAQNASAEEQVRRMAAEVTAQVRKNPDLLNSPTQLAALVQQRLMPHFDFGRITQIAMGRNWPKASGGEQGQVTSEFSKLLVRTYSNALASLRDLDVQVRDSRSNSGSDVTVRTQMIGQIGRAHV